MTQPVARSSLVTRRDAPRVWTMRCEGDTRHALIVGLADYIEDTVQAQTGGKPLKLQSVSRGWADGQKANKMPSAVVYTVGAGSYGTDANDAPMGGVGFRPTDRIGDSHVYVRTPVEFVQSLTVELWCAHEAERRVLAKAMEDALVAPVEWMYGARIALPHYHGAFGTYALVDKTMPDDEESAQANKRLVEFTVQGRVPVIVLARQDGVRVQVSQFEVDEGVLGL